HTGPGKRYEEAQADNKEPVRRTKEQHLSDRRQAHQLAKYRGFRQKETVALVESREEIGRIDVIIFERQIRVRNDAAKRKKGGAGHSHLRDALDNAGDGYKEINSTEC